MAADRTTLIISQPCRDTGLAEEMITPSANRFVHVQEADAAFL